MKLIDIKNLTFEYFRRDMDGNVEEIVEALKYLGNLKIEYTIEIAKVIIEDVFNNL